ncbi:MAG: hypothetical protein SH847_22685 [Roseiflexaceae bacterium]|nr:hypothetical protein [Roseiflexaceae bacterium]
MCGGIRFPYDAALDQALTQVYPTERLEQFKHSAVVEAFFWQAHPVLPALINGIPQLFDWGNREDTLRLPKTGWVRMESLNDGKWDYLRPREVIIPATAGVEQKVWFTINHGLRGIIVQRDAIERIYMLTMPPTTEYRTLTGHDRMPILIDQDSVHPIEPPNRQHSLGI